MKFTPKLMLTGLLLASAILFSKCKSDVEPFDPLIPYDETKAREHFISVDTAAKFTFLYRRGAVALGRQLRDSTYLKKRFNLPKAEMFNRDAVAALLNQAGAKGVRVYLGQDEAGQIRLILVAVDSKGNDITGVDGKIMKYTANADDGKVILESGLRCPDVCSATGPLD